MFDGDGGRIRVWVVDSAVVDGRLGDPVVGGKMMYRPAIAHVM